MFLEDLIGRPLDAVADSYYDNMPDWVFGSSISQSDARFLFRAALQSQPPLAVEIGTASGFSTGLLCFALECGSGAGLVDPDYKVVSYDISPTFYLRPEKKVGDAAREQLPPELLRHIVVCAPADAADIRRRYADNEVSFMFIDANHQHPWPALDLIAALDCLAPGAVVVMHDINLPLVHPEFAHWGAKHVFDNLDVIKTVSEETPFPNIGCITIPEDKQRLQQQVINIIHSHEWESRVPEEYLARLGLRGH
jgi:predicted O-methyltransferase YrrM